MLRWFCVGTVLIAYWYRAGTTLVLCWCGTVSLLVQCWYYAGSVLVQYWYRAGTVLVLRWFCTCSTLRVWQCGIHHICHINTAKNSISPCWHAVMADGEAFRGGGLLRPVFVWFIVLYTDIIT